MAEYNHIVEYLETFVKTEKIQRILMAKNPEYRILPTAYQKIFTSKHMKTGETMHRISFTITDNFYQSKYNWIINNTYDVVEKYWSTDKFPSSVNSGLEPYNKEMEYNNVNDEKELSVQYNADGSIKRVFNVLEL